MTQKRNETKQYDLLEEEASLEPVDVLDSIGPDQGDDDGTGLTLDRALIVKQDDYHLTLAEGLTIDTRETSPDVLDELLDMRQSYIGVIAKDPGNYINKWLRCLGCMVIPMERKVPVIDRISGEEITVTKQWEAVLFKIDRIDEDTQMHVIIKGGGQSSLEWAKLQAKMGRAGDWERPKEIMFSQEAIEVKRQKYDMATGQVQSTSGPGRMYRLVSRNIKER